MKTTKNIETNNSFVSTNNSHPYVSDGFFAKPVGEEYKIKVFYKNVVWIEAISNYSYIHFKDAPHLSLAYNIGKIEALLPNNTFVRISRSAIINIHFVDKYCGNIIFIAGRSFPVSASFREHVFSCFNELRRDD